MRKIIKKIVLALTFGMMMMVFAGCSNGKKVDEGNGNNFNIEVKSKQEFDYINYKIDGLEGKLQPMNDDSKVKDGYSSSVVLDEVETTLDLEVVKDGKVVLEKKDIQLDLTNGKKAIVSLIDKGNGVDIKVEYK